MSEHEAGINAAAKEMIAAGYIEETEDSNGNLIWTITEAGRDYMARLQEHEEDS